MREFKKLPLELFIGYDIEQNSRVIELDASEMVEKYPSGILQLVCKRPGEETTYIAPSFEQDGGTLRWTLTSYDVEKAGQGLAIVALVDTSEESVKVLASHKIRTGIEEGLHFRDAEKVDPDDSLIARVLAAVSQAQAYAQGAKKEADRAEAALDDVEDAKDQAISDIETKGQETLDSIPADYTALSGDVSDLKSQITQIANGHHYGARWDKANAKMTRTGLAAGITTTTTNFGHFGSVNANYSNPFDSIYPWSGRKLCNIDLDLYMGLEAGDAIEDCIVAWEGDPDFSYSHADGVWVYTPDFWGTSYDDGGYRYFDVCDKPLGGYVHYPPQITARNIGVKESRTIDGTAKNIVLPKLGMPCAGEAMSTIHTYAKNAKMSLDSIFSLDASSLLMLVEFANYDSQNAVGSGVSALYYESDAGKITAASTGDTVKVLKSQANAYAIPNAVFDIGTSKGGNQVGTFIVQSVADDGDYLNVTLDRAATVTTDHFYAIHGRAIIADSEIGGKSGYIGTNGKSDAYYRGESLWGNMWKYVLGVYKNSDGHVYLAADAKEADAYDAINTSVHTDTGVELASTGGYIKKLGFMDRSGKLAAPCFCTEVGGSSSAPVGDYFYTTTGSSRVLIVGGYAANGASVGLFHWSWGSASGSSSWAYAGRPRLLNP